ncbi:unnamed protein product [Rotaria magnacalcarata]|uniref:Uncharacterized protein n=1 Tax=Rotaria magnacalcarata TaxID=392030 RepID=A0A816PYE8_9BILA|nr:unnamed protein product [Rotaria magnacalcarata]
MYPGQTILTKNERQALTDRLANKNSQVCISVGIIRACGLTHATLSQARHDARLNYPSKLTHELLPGKPPLGNGLLQSSNSTAENMARIEKIQKAKPTKIPSSS